MTAGGRRTWRLLGADGRPYDSDRPGTLGGHRRTRIYGRLDCPSARAALARGGYARSRVFFADESTAVAAGYRPCAVCLRRRYDEWVAAGRGHTCGMISLAVTNVYVDDQDKALAFYTEVLGFEKKADIPLGEARWLTVVPPGQAGGVELLLEPNGNPIARDYQAALHQAGLPAHTVFASDDIHAEHARMTGQGVTFTMEPTKMGGTTQAVFDDTCGNLILLVQVG